MPEWIELKGSTLPNSRGEVDAYWYMLIFSALPPVSGGPPPPRSFVDLVSHGTGVVAGPGLPDLPPDTYCHDNGIRTERRRETVRAVLLTLIRQFPTFAGEFSAAVEARVRNFGWIRTAVRKPGGSFLQARRGIQEAWYRREAGENPGSALGRLLELEGTRAAPGLTIRPLLRISTDRSLGATRRVFARPVYAYPLWLARDRGPRIEFSDDGPVEMRFPEFYFSGFDLAPAAVAPINRRAAPDGAFRPEYEDNWVRVEIADDGAGDDVGEFVERHNSRITRFDESLAEVLARIREEIRTRRDALVNRRPARLSDGVSMERFRALREIVGGGGA